MKKLLIALFLLSAVPARAQVDVSYPSKLKRFGKWGTGAGVGDVTYSFATDAANMDLPGPNGTTLNHTAVRNAIEAAANTWNNANCCTNGVVHPGIHLAKTAGTVAPPSGTAFLKSGETGPLSSKPIWAASHDYACPDCAFTNNPCANECAMNFDLWPGTLGITVTSPSAVVSNGVEQETDYTLKRAFMLFNGFEANPDECLNYNNQNHAPCAVRWYIDNAGAAGCTDNQQCYDLRTVAIHEFGHFIGYLHDDTDPIVSVMYPNYAGQTQALYTKDIASVCANNGNRGYGHTACPSPTPEETQQDDPGQIVTNGGQTAGEAQPGTEKPANLLPRYYPCTNDNECSSFFLCRTFANGQKACDWPCTSTLVCQPGEVCGQSGFCFEPQYVTTSSSSSSTSTSSTTSSSSTSSTSSSSSSSSGTTAPLEPLPVPDFCAPCENRSDCLANTCVKFGESATPVCTVPCDNSNQCGTLGTCVGAGSNGFCAPKDLSCIQKAVERRGQLNEACGESNPCEPGLVCANLRNDAVCLEFCSSDGAKKCSTDGYSCLEVDKETKTGVCFKSTAREGESCVIPDTALCGFSGQYQCTGNADKGFQDAQCYKVCRSNGECDSSQTCVVTSTGVGVCNPIKVPECPLADFGQKCAKGEDCVSAYCATSGTDTACSHTCSPALQTGCPQNFTCRSTGVADNGYCWPANGVIKPAVECKKTGCAPGGGSCRGNNGDIALTLFAVAMVLFARRRARK